MRNIFILLIVISSIFTAYTQNLKIKKCETTPELIPFIQGKKMGYVDRSGSVKIKAIYDFAETFRFDFELFISENGNQFHSKDFATVEFKKNKYRINKNGKIVVMLDTIRYSPSDCCPEIIRKNKILVENRDSKKYYKVIDTLNNLIIGEKYDYITHIFSLDTNSDYFIVSMNKKYGVIDENNNILIPLEYNELSNLNSEASFNDGIIFCGTKNDKIEIIDLCGNKYHKD